MSEPQRDTARARARRRQQRNDTIFALVMLAFAVVMAFVVIPAGVRVPAAVTHLPLSPRFFPYVLVGITLFFSLAVLVETFVGPPPLPDDERPRELRRQWPLKVAILTAALLAYVQFPEWLGMLPVAILATLGLLLVGGERRIFLLLCIGVVAPTLVYLLFTEVFYVPMPVGRLLGGG